MGCNSGLPPQDIDDYSAGGKRYDLADTKAFSELMTDIYCMGERDYDPPYLLIQRFHALKLEVHLASGGKEEDFKCRIHKGLLNH